MERDLKALVAQMTLEEKAGLCSGADFWHTKAVERLGIPSILLSDGPHGLRKQDGQADHLGINVSIDAVCFPAACATTSSFDTALIRGMGETLGEECQAENLAVLLGPAVNIKRSPLCGRNFEYMSEDPYLAGKMAAAYIQGVQSKHVGTSIKHFAANNQEYNRMSSSSQVSERAMREIYLPAFEEAVKSAQPATVMCSYNKINGVYSADNHKLLTEVLRDGWGFKGSVVTDWGAVSDRVKGIQAGLELEMPSSGGVNDAKIVAAVKDDTLDEALLDRAVERILKVIFDFTDNRNPAAVFDRDADHTKAARVEEECAVLLQNNGVLPLKAGQKVVYIGAYAEKPRFQGGGSSHINTHRVVSALEVAQQKGRSVTFTQGFPYDGDETDENAVAQAVAAAKEAEVAVIFAGLPDSFESEGTDRDNMAMPACQNRVIEAVAAVQPNTVVVLHNGSPVEAPWADSVAAILEMYLGGEGVGQACDKLLYGEINPSGHLAESWPYKLADNPSYLNFGGGKTVDYAEGVYVGYRYYQAKQMPVRWCFGHGLSYTSFKVHDLTLDTDSMTDDTTVTASVQVTNTGDVAGKAVVQLYTADKNGTYNRPIRELKGFGKVALAPGETKTVTFTVDARALSYYDEELGDWYAPSGTYELQVGLSCEDIRETAAVHFTTAKLLPLVVTGATTLGELLADPRTAPIVQHMMAAAAAQRGGSNDDQADADGNNLMSAKAMRDMMSGMPIKSLAAFGGLSVDNLIAMFSVAVK